MIATISQLKNWFSRGYIPTQDQYHAWIDSFFHKDESVPVTKISGLQDLLDQKQDIANVNNHIVIVSASEVAVTAGENLVLALTVEPTMGDVYEFELWYKTLNIPVGELICLINNNSLTPGLKLGTSNNTNQVCIFKGKLTYYNDAWRGIMEMHNTNSSDIIMADFELYDPAKIEIIVIADQSAIVQYAFIKKVN